MTDSVLINKKKKYESNILLICCLGIAVAMVLIGDIIREEIYAALIYSSSIIIPSIFPFFVLSDFWSATFYFNENGIFPQTFKKFFGICGTGLVAFISGLICGFPVGVKIASGLYKDNCLSKRELEQICGFVNNPSIAFVISGVGGGVFKDIRIGILLYISVVISATIVGIAFREKNGISSNSTFKTKQSFNIVESIRSAGLNSINVISCIVFFSGVLGLLRGIIKNEIVVLFLSIFIEVTSAVKLIYSSHFSKTFKLILTAFALGFSGFSVHLQAFSFLPSEVSKKKYFIMKFFQGIISALLILFITNINRGC